MNTVTYQNSKLSADGSYYISGFQNNAYVSQTISSTAYGTYGLSFYYRLPTAWKNGAASVDYCQLYGTLDSKTLFTAKVNYGSTIVSGTPMSLYTVSGIPYTSASAGVFTLGWTCTNNAAMSADIDAIVLKQTSSSSGSGSEERD